MRDVQGLIDAGLATAEDRDALEAVASRFSIGLTEEVTALAQTSSPISRQFVPQAAELRITPAELQDPIGDRHHSPVAGVVHRYPDRALLMPLQVCAVYCRFCFRRETVGGQQPEALLQAERLDDCLDYIRQTPTLWEIVLSGGDPLLLAPRRLESLIARLSQIEHVRVIRVHTRIPVVAPGRVNTALLHALRTDRAVFVAVHANHPDEFTGQARDACRRLADAGLPLLGQTVLLRGINDDEATLEALMRAMVENRIKPYYLHHGDLAQGTGHFRVGIARGQQLMESLRGRVSGLCQPTYVLDLPGGGGKVPVGPTYATRTDDGEWLLRDRFGASHRVADLA
ncbi:MAG: lysine-2,3-aminomutase-like protein [Pseudomonadota bacterium]